MVDLRIPYSSPAAEPVWGEKTAPLKQVAIEEQPNQLNVKQFLRTSKSYDTLTSSETDLDLQDYVITAWIAEFINTLTNISYLLYAFYGIHKFWNHRSFWSRTSSYWGIAGVGVGSAIFHGSLRKWPQFSDDLSMFVATGIIFQRIMSYRKSETQRRNYGLSITAVLVIISFYHCWAEEKIVHQAVFVGMVVIIARKTRIIIRDHVSDPIRKRQLVTLAKTGSYYSIAALTLWLIDEKACSYLQQIRDVVGLPWGFLFEFHGWWHILTAIGVYDYFVLVEIITGDGDIERNLAESSPFAWPVSSQFGKTKARR